MSTVAYLSDPLLARARALAPLAAAGAAAAEKARTLPAHLVEAMAEAHLFALCAPSAVGGEERDPLTTIAVIEALARADGAAGWVLMIGIEATGIGTAYLDPDYARDLMCGAGRPAVITGAINPMGRARRVAGGYVVTGRWPFASGSTHSDYFWGQCLVEGTGEALEALLPRRSYSVLDTWHVAGLCATGSHDVEATEVFVPDHQITYTRRGRPRHDGPLFRYPLMARLAYNKVGVCLGVARGAIDAFVELANTKTPRFESSPLRERPRAQRAVAEAEAAVRGARSFCFEVVGDLWSTIVDGDHATAEQKALVRLACSSAALTCIKAVQTLHEAAGTSVNFLSSRLGRCMRDAQVVSQHIMVAPHFIDDAGRVLLGLAPASPVF